MINLKTITILKPFILINLLKSIVLNQKSLIYIHSKIPIANPSEDELAMLSEAFNVKNNSRLGCQIPINKEIEGLVFEIAPE